VTNTDQQIVQAALSRTMVDRFTNGVPVYTEMSDTELLAAVEDARQKATLPMWEMVLELARRLQERPAA
jgi:hypothetical protein